ncbi:MAG: 50S ribosomal protein L23 [Blastocatellia bacterium]|nr:50S ribosomal protein L23 [Blastocatellia bacterium]MBL8193008.1 50S ribosomal protein L23 [Blastocatellia bacterium]MBN8723221.1 50S ribosomal protein L23 [Acidobacteriota bacterium]
MRSVWDVIKGPVITEKALRLKESSQDGKQKLVFYVDRSANKIEVKNAVKAIFKVDAESVRIANYQGKMKRRGRFEGRQSDWRKAYVTLKAGEKVIEYGDVV